MPFSREEATQVVNLALKEFDTDHNGSLDRAEAANLFRKLFAGEGVDLNQDQLELIISSIDENSDNVISKEEMIDLLVNNL